MACSSRSATPEMADVGNGAADQRQGDGVADQGADTVLPDLMPEADTHDMDVVDMNVDILDLQVDTDASCVPVCGGAVCGDDGCGGSCGQCDLGTTCQQGQ